jgi:hypothetical protein
MNETTDLQRRRGIKIEIKRLAGLEEELAIAVRLAAGGDPAASLERAAVLNEIAAQKRVISRLQGGVEAVQ